jgi:hypothetical protein
MSPEPIRDYVGEALARSANGKAAAFNTNRAGDDAMSAANGTGVKEGGFKSKAREVPNQQRDSQRQEQPSPHPQDGE